MKIFLKVGLIIGFIMAGLIILGLFVMNKNPDYAADHAAPTNCALHQLTLSEKDIPAALGRYHQAIQRDTIGGYGKDVVLNKLKGTVLLSNGKPIDYFARQLFDKDERSQIFMSIVSFPTPNDALSEWLMTKQRYQDIMVQKMSPSAAAEKFQRIPGLAADHALIDARGIQRNDWVFIGHNSNVFWIMNFSLSAPSATQDIRTVLNVWNTKFTAYQKTRSGGLLCDVSGRT